MLPLNGLYATASLPTRPQPPIRSNFCKLCEIKRVEIRPGPPAEVILNSDSPYPAREASWPGLWAEAWYYIDVDCNQVQLPLSVIVYKNDICIRIEGTGISKCFPRVGNRGGGAAAPGQGGPPAIPAPLENQPSGEAPHGNDPRFGTPDPGLPEAPPNKPFRFKELIERYLELPEDLAQRLIFGWLGFVIREAIKNGDLEALIQALKVLILILRARRGWMAKALEWADTLIADLPISPNQKRLLSAILRGAITQDPLPLINELKSHLDEVVGALLDIAKVDSDQRALILALLRLLLGEAQDSEIIVLLLEMFMNSQLEGEFDASQKECIRNYLRRLLDGSLSAEELLEILEKLFGDQPEATEALEQIRQLLDSLRSAGEIVELLKRLRQILEQESGDPLKQAGSLVELIEEALSLLERFDPEAGSGEENGEPSVLPDVRQLLKAIGCALRIARFLRDLKLDDLDDIAKIRQKVAEIIDCAEQLLNALDVLARRLELPQLKNLVAQARDQLKQARQDKNTNAALIATIGALIFGLALLNEYSDGGGLFFAPDDGGGGGGVRNASAFAGTPCSGLVNNPEPKATWDWEIVPITQAGSNWQPFDWKKVKSMAAIPKLQSGGSGASGATAFLRFIGGVNQTTEDAGHVLGRQWGGKGGRTLGNVFPQNQTSNRSAMNLRDNAVKRLQQAGSFGVCIKITLQYNDPAPAHQHRPSAILYETWNNGTKSNDPLFTTAFENPR